MTDTEFAQEVERTITFYEEMTGHAAARTRPMIERYGEIKALSRLMVSADLQQGFKVLRDNNQLEKSFEALVVKYQHLFQAPAVEAAQWRLSNPYELL
ncbi:hypothetical protein QLQ85_08205 [Halomonas sp. M4R5S39]|uniref:hypothetical protein n=1 Tax=Halomonas kalidii TaxID=3043293 RepID=UPI0024A810BE|nr:hypothetical protein [Halomonas kalidii]MDI5984770.1 hypothetical protein [Halomonas kalidii]